MLKQLLKEVYFQLHPWNKLIKDQPPASNKVEKAGDQDQVLWRERCILLVCAKQLRVVHNRQQDAGGIARHLQALEQRLVAQPTLRCCRHEAAHVPFRPHVVQKRPQPRHNVAAECEGAQDLLLHDPDRAVQRVVERTRARHAHAGGGVHKPPR